MTRINISLDLTTAVSGAARKHRAQTQQLILKEGISQVPPVKVISECFRLKQSWCTALCLLHPLVASIQFETHSPVTISEV